MDNDNNIISLQQHKRNVELRDIDANCKARDPQGREIFLFTLSYRHDDQTHEADYGFHIWATSMEDAMARVESIKRTLKCDGQVYSIIEDV